MLIIVQYLIRIFLAQYNINGLFFVLAIVMYQLAGFGITAGAHRLWSHRAYKAKWPLRLFLTFCNTLAFEVSILLF